MKVHSLLAGAATAALLATGGGVVSAQTLQEALSSAYQNNPTLQAQRAAQRATDENVPQALSGWRPTVTFESEFGKGSIDVDRDDGGALASTVQTGSNNITPFSNSIVVNQPLYRGGRTTANVSSAEALVLAGRATLDSTEQTILASVVQAYMDVLRDQAVLDLNRSNEQVLRRQLEAANDRFRVGEITRTDVSQAEARLSRATSDRIQAEGALISSRAVFQRVVGQMPTLLEPPPTLPQLPPTEEAALTVAMDENPDLQAAAFQEEASRYDIRSAFGNLLPSVSLVGQLSSADETTTPGVRQESARVTAQVSVPLYQSGANYSLVRQRSEINSQRRVEIEETRRQVRENVTRAWENFNTARAAIISRRAQVEASRVALDGVTQEAQVGSRTTLDVLDAEQELLDSQVALVQSQRDEYVAAYNLLAAIGRLSAEDIGLPVERYDPTEHYRDVRNKWFGLGDYSPFE